MRWHINENYEQEEMEIAECNAWTSNADKKQTKSARLQINLYYKNTHVYRLWYIFKNTLIIIKHADLWEAGGLTIIKHLGERTLKSHCNLLVMKSENY